MSLNCSDQDAASQLSKSFLRSHKGNFGWYRACLLSGLAAAMLGENGPLCISVAVGQRPVLKVFETLSGLFLNV